MTNEQPDALFIQEWTPPKDIQGMCSGWLRCFQYVGKDKPDVCFKGADSLMFGALASAGATAGEFFNYVLDHLAEGLTPENVARLNTAYIYRLDWLRRPYNIPRTCYAAFPEYMEARRKNIKDTVQEDLRRFGKNMSSGLNYILWVCRADMNPVSRMHFARLILDGDPSFGETLKDTVEVYVPKAISMLLLERDWASWLGVRTANWVLENYRRITS